MKELYRYLSMEFGEQFVMITGEMLMLELYVTCLDLEGNQLLFNVKNTPVQNAI